MFIIKNYDRYSMEYSCYECNQFRKEYAGIIKEFPNISTNCPMPPFVPFHGYTLILDEKTYVQVHGTAYIENTAGKTIDTIKAHDVNPDELRDKPDEPKVAVPVR